MNVIRKSSLCVAMLCALGAGSAAAATDAERIAALEAQLEQQRRLLEAMQSELQQLKSGQPGEETVSAVAQSTVVESAPQVVAESRVAARAAAGADRKLSLSAYGFVQADAIYDFKRVDPDWEDTLRVSTIPTRGGADGNDGDFIFSVRQSRLGFKGDYGNDVTYKLEGELFGVGSDQGQTTLRLRHAWATYRNFGMGQTSSNFMDIDIFPNTIDYWGPTGMVFYRNQQARYTFPLGDDEFALSIEDPDTALTVGRFRDVNNCNLPDPAPDCGSVNSTAEDVFQAYNDLPDLTARYRRNGDFGHLQVAGILRKLGYERLDNGDQDHELGWGINTSTALRTVGADQLKLQLVYGKGIGNYMNDGGVDIAPDSADINTVAAEAVPILGISAYYDRYWNDRWSTSVGWSMTDLDASDGQADNEFKRGQIAQINLLHYPLDNVMVGTEFIWGQREDVDGNTGTDYRIQLSLKVAFDSGNLAGGN